MNTLTDVQKKTIEESIILVDNFDPEQSYTKHEMDLLRFAESVKTLLLIGQNYESNIKQIAAAATEYKIKYESLIELIDIKMKQETTDAQQKTDSKDKKDETKPKRKYTRKNKKSTETADERKRVQKTPSNEQHKDGVSDEKPKEATSV